MSYKSDLFAMCEESLFLQGGRLCKTPKSFFLDVLVLCTFSYQN